MREKPKNTTQNNGCLISIINSKYKNISQVIVFAYSN